MDNRQVQLERSNHVLTAMGVDTRNAKVMDRTQYLTFDGKGKSSVVLLIDSNTKKARGEKPPLTLTNSIRDAISLLMAFV